MCLGAGAAICTVPPWPRPYLDSGDEQGGLGGLARDMRLRAPHIDARVVADAPHLRNQRCTGAEEQAPWERVSPRSPTRGRSACLWLLPLLHEGGGRTSSSLTTGGEDLEVSVAPFMRKRPCTE